MSAECSVFLLIKITNTIVNHEQLYLPSESFCTTVIITRKLRHDKRFGLRVFMRKCKRLTVDCKRV